MPAAAIREAIKRPSTHLECHQARCDGARGELRELRERSVQSLIGEAAGRKHEGRLATECDAPARVAKGCAADDDPVELS